MEINKPNHWGQNGLVLLQMLSSIWVVLTLLLVLLLLRGGPQGGQVYLSLRSQTERNQIVVVVQVVDWDVGVELLVRDQTRHQHHPSNHQHHQMECSLCEGCAHSLLWPLRFGRAWLKLWVEGQPTAWGPWGPSRTLWGPQWVAG